MYKLVVIQNVDLKNCLLIQGFPEFAENSTIQMPFILGQTQQRDRPPLHIRIQFQLTEAQVKCAN